MPRGNPDSATRSLLRWPGPLLLVVFRVLAISLCACVVEMGASQVGWPAVDSGPTQLNIWHVRDPLFIQCACEKLQGTDISKRWDILRQATYCSFPTRIQLSQGEPGPAPTEPE